jgi:hypothetical protein
MAVGYLHFERRAANRAGDRAHDAKLGKLVVALRCEHKGWAASLLLVALGGVEVEPDDVANGGTSTGSADGVVSVGVVRSC